MEWTELTSREQINCFDEKGQLVERPISLSSCSGVVASGASSHRLLHELHLLPFQSLVKTVQDWQELGPDQNILSLF